MALRNSRLPLRCFVELRIRGRVALQGQAHRGSRGAVLVQVPHFLHDARVVWLWCFKTIPLLGMENPEDLSVKCDIPVEIRSFKINTNQSINQFNQYTV